MPSLRQGQDFRLGSQMDMVHSDLTQVAARGGRILLRDRVITRTNGLTPVTGSYPDQTRCMGKLDPVEESCPG